MPAPARPTSPRTRLALLSGRSLQQVPPTEITLLRRVHGAVKDDDE
ncbi:hypothetical protein [Nonomuraea sp. NPDC002799]